MYFRGTNFIVNLHKCRHVIVATFINDLLYDPVSVGNSPDCFNHSLRHLPLKIIHTRMQQNYKIKLKFKEVQICSLLSLHLFTPVISLISFCFSQVQLLQRYRLSFKLNSSTDFIFINLQIFFPNGRRVVL